MTHLGADRSPHERNDMRGLVAKRSPDIAAPIRATLAVALALWLAAFPARAETVEVAPGVQVTKRSYPAPINEQPFFGFVVKDAAQREADEKFVTALTQATGSREKAFLETTARGWKAISTGNAAEAARRFNQAFLVGSEQSSLYHGMAIVAMIRFNDPDFADELFSVARRQPGPLKALNADYGRVLLIAKRPRDAQPVLEQAVIDAPDFGDAWSNLAQARLQNGDRAAACVAAGEAGKRHPSANASRDLATLMTSAKCQ
jgi:Tfp pilus assembly protein PilF